MEICPSASRQHLDFFEQTWNILLTGFKHYLSEDVQFYPSEYYSFPKNYQLYYWKEFKIYRCLISKMKAKKSELVKPIILNI